MADLQTSLPPKIITNAEDAQIAMSVRAESDGDEWRVKVLRRASPGATQESIAIIDGATIEQLMNPEPWLSKLAGGTGNGGSYTFRVVHVKDKIQDRPIAIFTTPTIAMAPRMPDPKIVDSPEWPHNLALWYIAGQEKTNGAAKAPVVVGGAPELTTHGATPAREKGDGSAALLFIQEERRKLEEERHRIEMDSIRRAADEDRKRLEAKFNDVLESLRETRAKPAVDPMETIAKVVTAMAPIMAPIVALISAGREAAARREETQRAREAEINARREERESKLMEKLATSSAEQGKVISVFTDSLAQTARAMVQTVAMVGELRQPEAKETGIMDVIREAIGAWAESQARMPAPQLTPGQSPRPPAPPQAGPPIASAPVNTSAPPSNAQPDADEGDDREEVEVTPEEVMNMMANDIGKHATVSELAPEIVGALRDSEFTAALVKAGGAVGVLKSRLGETWGADPANIAYLQSLFGQVGEIAAANGVDIRPMFPGT